MRPVLRDDHSTEIWIRPSRNAKADSFSITETQLFVSKKKKHLIHNMSFNKNTPSASASNNKFAILAKQFNRERQNSGPLLTCAAPALPAHASAQPKSPCALAQSSSSGAPAPIDF